MRDDTPRDAVLDTSTADLVASLVTRDGVSVADAHIGALVHGLPAADHPVAVLTRDPGDIRVVSGVRHVRVVTL